MKLRISIIAALLAFVSIAGADTPTLEASLVAYVEGKAVSGLNTTPYYMSDEAAHAALAAEIVTALQAGESFTANTHVVLTPYGNAFYAAGEDASAAEVFRASGNYGSVSFLMKSATSAEISEHLLGINANVYKIVKDSAAPRLGDSEIADTVAESLVGTGIVATSSTRDGTNEWVEWFDAEVLSVEKAEALSLLSAEIKGLLTKPQEDNPAWSARLSSLQGTHAVLERL